MVTAVRQSRQPDLTTMKTVFPLCLVPPAGPAMAGSEVHRMLDHVGTSRDAAARRAHPFRKRTPTPSTLAPHTTSKTTSLVHGHIARLGPAAYLGPTPSDGETPGYTPTRRQNALPVTLPWRI